MFRGGNQWSKSFSPQQMLFGAIFEVTAGSYSLPSYFRAENLYCNALSGFFVDPVCLDWTLDRSEFSFRELIS